MCILRHNKLGPKSPKKGPELKLKQDEVLCRQRLDVCVELEEMGQIFHLLFFALLCVTP